MRIAFIILSHKNPQQLCRLLGRLQHPAVDCYIHLDAKANILEWQDALHFPQVSFITKRANVTWAGYGTIRAALNGIEHIGATGKQYGFIHLISAQDYPLADIDVLYHFFAGNPGQQFLDLLPPEALQRMMSKITAYYFEDLRFPGKYRIASLVNKILPARRHPFNLEVYGGSLWWSLTQECALWCAQYVKDHPRLERFYKYTWGGDEFIFQTLIMNSPFKDTVRNSYMRYIDWSEGHAHPKTFTIQDLDKILQSGQLLARKFDMDKAPELLDQIDLATKR
ncbi:beta-1,6-N-acetylglucosaminyltransferase [Chitinophaga polysaccharea]|uniref:beta-1,6-N-acetylglucosaminyltransferase n=1 Tax=Chitinophaga TaxID=79328 RepID=UPI0014559961|nr:MULTISPECIES: beta-1,6-N-acetylglucosaminyltransferase [Chitinophaga]NLR60192.1 beta-1,6-N-acetylglucosaminyltransferase [Chitinophaga polysaccharea]NLU95840.1 beta-1,6-N-acetylglucosaminyltransferase [Chitinophaga sp. Ak27]